MNFTFDFTFNEWINTLLYPITQDSLADLLALKMRNPPSQVVSVEEWAVTLSDLLTLLWMTNRCFRDLSLPSGRGPLSPWSLWLTDPDHEIQTSPPSLADNGLLSLPPPCGRHLHQITASPSRAGVLNPAVLLPRSLLSPPSCWPPPPPLALL